MATITGLTAERMREIEAASIVDGTINASGNLILTAYDGTEIDAGNALVAVPDNSIVHQLDANGFSESTPPGSYSQGVSVMSMSNTETVADWPTFSGKFGSLFTVNHSGDVTQLWRRLHGNSTTPEAWIRSGNVSTSWSPWKQLATTEYVDTKLAVVNGKQPGDSITTYPSGLSMSTMSGNGAGEPTWNSVPSTQFGTIITANGGTLRSFQLMQVEDGYLHFRRYREDSGGWRPWQKVLTEQRLTVAAGYNQSTVFTSYPWGLSYLYLNNSDTATSWSTFSGKFGLITTYRFSDDFAVQTWQKHQGGLGNQTELWQRTANASGGWSSWRVIASDTVDDTGWVNVTPASGFVSSPTTTQYTAAARRLDKVVRFRGVLTGTIAVATTTVVGNVPAGIPLPPKGTNFNFIGNTGGFIGWSNISETGVITVHFKTPYAGVTSAIDLASLSYTVD